MASFSPSRTAAMMDGTKRDKELGGVGKGDVLDVPGGPFIRHVGVSRNHADGWNPQHRIAQW